MSDYVNSDIPSTGGNAVTTVERLFAWSGLLLVRLAGNLSVLEDDGSPLPVMSAAVIRAGDETNRLILRGSLILPSDFQSSGKKLWVVNSFNNTAIPEAFKS